MTADGSSRMNLEVYRAKLSASIQLNAAKVIGLRFTADMNNDPKHKAKTTKDLQWPSQSPSLNPIELASQLL